MKFNKLKPLIKRGLFTAADAREVGVHPRLLSYYMEKGLLERIQRGVYKGSDTNLKVDFKWEDLVLASNSIKNGIVCLVSALAIYELTDEIPRRHWIATPHNTSAPRRKGVKIIRMRNLELGKTTIKLGEEKINIFDRERTIIDAFRYLGREAAIKALKEAIKSKKKIDLKKLELYAKKLRVNIEPYIITVTT